MAQQLKSLSETIARFGDKVDSSDEWGCWPWTSSVDVHGYGKFSPDSHLAERFGVSRAAIYFVRKGTHYPDEAPQ